MKKLAYEQQAAKIYQMITESDYTNAQFTLHNTNPEIRVRKNILQFYDNAEIINSAHHVITNYEIPNFTFTKMREILNDDTRTIRLLKSAIPYWRRAVNAYVRAYTKKACKFK